MKIDKKGEGCSMQEELRVGGGGVALLHFYQLRLSRHGDGGTLQTPCKDNLSPYHAVPPFLALSLSLQLSCLFLPSFIFLFF